MKILEHYEFHKVAINVMPALLDCAGIHVILPTQIHQIQFSGHDSACFPFFLSNRLIVTDHCSVPWLFFKSN